MHNGLTVHDQLFIRGKNLSMKKAPGRCILLKTAHSLNFRISNQRKIYELNVPLELQLVKLAAVCFAKPSKLGAKMRPVFFENTRAAALINFI